MNLFPACSVLHSEVFKWVFKCKTDKQVSNTAQVPHRHRRHLPGQTGDVGADVGAFEEAWRSSRSQAM